MSSRTEVKFQGGPLDGTTYSKRLPGRHPIYRDIDGYPMDVATGDRIMGGRSHIGQCYRLVSDHAAPDLRTVTYKIATTDNQE